MTTVIKKENPVAKVETLPHCDVELSKRIAGLRAEVDKMNASVLKMANEFGDLEEGQKAKHIASFHDAKMQLRGKYNELLGIIAPIVENAEESKADIAHVATREEAESIYNFWMSFYDHPIASLRLAQVCMRLGSFCEVDGKKEDAKLFYSTALKHGKTAEQIIGNSGLGPSEASRVLKSIRDMNALAAVKSGDAEENAKAAKLAIGATLKMVGLAEMHGGNQVGVNELIVNTHGFDISKVSGLDRNEEQRKKARKSDGREDG